MVENKAVGETKRQFSFGRLPFLFTLKSIQESGMSRLGGLVRGKRKVLFEADAGIDWLESVYSNLPSGIVVVDRNGRLIYMNSRAIGLYGQKIEPGVFFADDMFRSARKGKTLYGREEAIIRPDGSKVSVVSSAAPVLDEDGDVIAAVKTIEFAAGLREGDKNDNSRDLQALFDSVPVMFAVWDPLTMGISANKFIREVTGWTAEDVSDPGFLSKVYPDPEYRKMVEEYMLSLKPGFKELVMTARDGSRIETVWANVALPDGRNIGIGLDNRKRKRAEQGLQQSLRKFELFSHVANELLLSKEPERNVDSICGKAMEYLDCEVFLNFLLSERTGRLRLNAYAGISPDEAKKIEWLDYGVSACGCGACYGEPVVFERIGDFCDPRTDMVKSFGVKAFVSHPIIGSEGKVLGTLAFGSKNRESFRKDEIALVRALTGQVAVAMSRIVNEKAVQESEERYRELVDRAPDAILVLQAERIVYCNQAAAELYGAGSRLKLVRMSLADIVHRADQEKAGEEAGAAMESGELSLLELRNVRLDGIEIVVEIVGTRIRWQGQPALQVIIRDISERKQAEEVLKRDKEVFERLVKERTLELLSAQMELEHSKRLSDIGMLATTVAHELRNPLAAISMAVTNISRKAQNPALATHLETIAKKVTESDQIINNLLFYSRLKSPNLERVRIDGVVSESVRTAADRAEGIKIRFDPGECRELVIDVDALQMKEVFVNILNNAVDAIKESPGGEISVHTVIEKKMLNIVFRDNGCGMGKETLEMAMDPFFTTKSKGTGLGLAVCQQVVNLHNGRVKLTSEEGKGTTVTVSLPLTRKVRPRET